MNFIAKWFISALGLLLASGLLAGVEISSVYTALVVAVFLGFLNAVIRPVLFILTLPITVLTLGLFTFVLNGLIFWFLSSFIKGFYVDGFFWAIAGAFVVSVFSWFGSQFLNGNSDNHNQNKNNTFYSVDKIEKP